MKKLMAIFAHPDDEGAIAGTLSQYANQGVEVTLVCATRGEVGEISDPALATAETLGDVREKELNTACEILGIQQLRMMSYRDSGMDGTPENEDPRALVQANPDEAIGEFVRLIREVQPDVVVTFEPYGWYGHPDHIAVSRWATAAFPLTSDPTAYPDKGAAWQPKRLFHAVIPFSKFGAVIEEAIAAGYIESDGFGDRIQDEAVIAAETAVTHIIPITDLFDTKQKAMMAHRTQFGPDSMFRKIPKEMMIKMSGNEHFIQISPTPSPELRQNRLSDLFAGL